MGSSRFRVIIPGAAYFITSVTHHRKRWFTDPAHAGIVTGQLQYYANEFGFTLDCFVVMPDHYHAVITPGEKKTISEILHGVNSYSTTMINERLGKKEKVKIWQGDPWDMVARDEGMFWRMIGYTLLNPWRAGLVTDPLQDYPFSDIGQWKSTEGDEFLLDLFAQIRDFREFGEG